MATPTMPHRHIHHHLIQVGSQCPSALLVPMRPLLTLYRTHHHHHHIHTTVPLAQRMQHRSHLGSPSILNSNSTMLPKLIQNTHFMSTWSPNNDQTSIHSNTDPVSMNSTLSHASHTASTEAYTNRHDTGSSNTKSNNAWEAFTNIDLATQPPYRIHHLISIISSHEDPSTVAYRLISAYKAMAESGCPILVPQQIRLYNAIRSAHTNDIELMLKYTSLLIVLHTDYAHLCTVQISPRQLRQLMVIAGKSQNKLIMADVQRIGVVISGETLTDGILNTVDALLFVHDHVHARALLAHCGASHHPDLLSAVAMFLARTGDPAEADALMRQCVANTIRLRESIYVYVLAGYLGKREYELARIWMAWIPSTPWHVYTDAWSLWIRKMFKIAVNHTQEVLPFVDDFLNNPTTVVHNRYLFNVVFGLMTAGDSAAAFSYFDRICLKGDLIPSGDALAVLEACQILDSSSSDTLEQVASRIENLTHITGKSLSIMIHAYLKRKELPNALHVYDVMTKMGTLGTMHQEYLESSLHMFLCYYLRYGNKNTAFEFYRNALKNGTIPNGRVFKLLLELSFNDLNDATYVWQCMMAHMDSKAFLPLSSEMYTFSNERLSYATSADFCKSENQRLASVLSKSPLFILQSARETKGAGQSMLLSKRLSISPSRKSISSADTTETQEQHRKGRSAVNVDASYTKHKDPPNRQSTAVTHTLKRYPGLTVDHYRYMLIAFINKDMYDEAKKLIQDMHERGIEMSPHMFLSLAMAKYKRRDIDACLNIIQMARLDKRDVSTTMLQLQVSAHCSARQLSLARKVLNETISRRELPPPVMLQTIANAYYGLGEIYNLCQIMLCCQACRYPLYRIDESVQKLWKSVGGEIGGTYEQLIHDVSSDQETIDLCSACEKLANAPKWINSTRRHAISSMLAARMTRS
ncbi:hypothetical protein BASA50_004993 [Batrachochytrium salamandrivorans]|uniref:Pentacotripeptide-repeat region of PRORP domain-containing protein n=1 Tax=Batrachochytrium salamandrivorans TaxID=1357716 RepID=A0ABQ8FFD4_9FUNG|nr:hypothetical protein BASA50_004993 [Batrachochytrium salamandrivorans]KAH9270459.1 hypothetical protein BASA83_007459 [Batrachochytrium salamandrivorans]